MKEVLHLANKYTISESLIQSKTGNELENEDALVVSDAFIAVIDGASSKNQNAINQKTLGRHSREIIEKVIHELQTDAQLNDFIDLVNQEMQDFYLENHLIDLVQTNPENRLNASVVVLSLERGELWVLGDCQALVDGNLIKKSKLIDDQMSQFRQNLITKYLETYTVAQLRDQDVSRQDLIPFLKSQYHFQNDNNPHSLLNYIVLDGFEMNRQRITILDVSGANEIILASDGYPQLHRTLEASEAELQRAIALDPLMYQIYPGTKGVAKDNLSFDDRTYIRLERLQID